MQDMVHYNIPFRGSRQPDRCDIPVLLGAPGIARVPLSRHRHNWRAALTGTALIHVCAILPVLLLTSDPVPPSAETGPAIEMVFAQLTPAQAAPMPEPPATQAVETAPSPAQASPPQDQPVPPVPESLQQPSPPETHQPEVQAPLPPAEEPEPLPLPPPAAPPPPIGRATAPRKAVMPPRKASAAPIPSTSPPPSLPPAAEAAPPSPPATVSTAWRQALAAWLAVHKTYPEQARRQGIEGSVTLRFNVDRVGHVMDVTVLRGSGSPILDSAAQTMLRNAMLPPPAPAVQDRITVLIQLHYKLAD
jgi:periplasmic protein TonB